MVFDEGKNRKIVGWKKEVSFQGLDKVSRSKTNE